MKNFLLNRLYRHSSKWIVLIIDLLLVIISFVFSYFIRFEASFSFDKYLLLYQIPYIVLLSLLSFIAVGSYKGIIRHTGLRDVVNVFLATSLIVFLGITIILGFRAFNIYDKFQIPISILIINYFVSTFFLISSRFVFKTLYEVVTQDLSNDIRVLIYGAGHSGLITYNALQKDGKTSYKIVGFVDDDEQKKGKKIDRVKIFHGSELTALFFEKYRVKEVILSIQNISSTRLLAITDDLINKGIEVKIVPSLERWIGGDFQASQIKQVKIEDLLDRKPIKIVNSIVERETSGKSILITGAAGSIGSEISRQLSEYSYKQLILLDQAESDLYDLQQEFYQSNKKNIEVVVINITDEYRVREVFERYKPQKVFHAAAYKHVPLMEKNPYEAIKTNVRGTKIVVDLSVKNKVEQFVMISTDKAVNPTNIMGATKRIAELYVACMSRQHSMTKFTTTRFGNVLGSNGSVIPLFRRQLRKGGPLTVTHKDITRYFMTIPEACNLVLEAGTMGKGGEIYIFDMGKPVKIYEIAKKMIHLSGFSFPDEVDIKITGLRPGEKLYEELLANGENTQKTYHDKILIAKVKDINCSSIQLLIEELCSKKNVSDNDINLVRLMKNIVPEFKSNNSIYQKLDVEYPSSSYEKM